MAFFDRRRWPYRDQRSPTGRFCWEPCWDALCGQRRRFMRCVCVRSGSRTAMTVGSCQAENRFAWRILGRAVRGCL